MDEKRPPVPIGIVDFGELRDGGYYYVDKSELISDIVGQRSKVFLFTRPRRFGKSLNLSMIQRFFDLEDRGNHWFDGLRVMDHPDAVAQMGTRPVIHIDMKDLPVDNFHRGFIPKLAMRLSEVFRRFDYLLESPLVDDVDLEMFRRGRRRGLSAVEMQDALRLLCRMLSRHHGIAPVLLIDEYDDPINNSYNRRTHGMVLDFLRLFYSGALKDQDDLGFAVVTGVMQIGKESIFSGLNSLYVNSILSPDYDERYGFTPSEVESLCRAYGRPDAFAEAREWYDGYLFGRAEIYNPWSLLNYIVTGFTPGSYWSVTSGNDILDTLLDHADERTYKDLDDLANGRPVLAKISPTVVMKDIGRKRRAVYSVMAMAGYLRAVPSGNRYLVSVPNKEMREVFASIMEDRIHSDAETAFGELFDGLESANIGMIRDGMQFILDENIPFILLTKEKDYELIIGAAAMSRLGRYTVSLEKESGNGRADILMTRNTPGCPDIVLELKKVKSKSRADLKKVAEDAVGQIRERSYIRQLSGRVLMYGIAFRSKDFEISFEETEL